MDLARRVAHLPGMHQLTTHRRFEPLAAAAVRSRFVRGSGRFFLREALDRPGSARYALREARDVAVVLRHGTPDTEAFDEVFVRRIYSAPLPVLHAMAVLERPPRIADLGANVGLFAAWASAQFPGCTVTCFEPDPFNLAVLGRANTANGGAWEVIEACAAARDGEVPFAAGRFAVSRVLADGEDASAAIRVPARDAFPVLERADLIKIDIEGGEWPILGDPRFTTLSARALAIEYHPEGCPEPDARAAAVARLAAAGFETQDVPTAAPPGYGSLWAWKAAA